MASFLAYFWQKEAIFRQIWPFLGDKTILIWICVWDSWSTENFTSIGHYRNIVPIRESILRRENLSGTVYFLIYHRYQKCLQSGRLVDIEETDQIKWNFYSLLILLWNLCCENFKTVAQVVHVLWVIKVFVKKPKNSIFFDF